MNELSNLALLGVCGAGGALVRSLYVHKGSIVLWRKWETPEGEKGIDLGIISSLIIGIAVGLVVDQSPVTAFVMALSGSSLIEELMKDKGAKK